MAAPVQAITTHGRRLGLLPRVAVAYPRLAAAWACSHWLQALPAACRLLRPVWACSLVLQAWPAARQAAQGAAVGCQPLRGWWLPTAAAAYGGGGPTVQNQKILIFKFEI